MTRHDRARPDRILSVIEEFNDVYGHPPSVRQIMVRVDLASTSAVHHHLRQLVKSGRVVACDCGCKTYRLAFDETAA